MSTGSELNILDLPTEVTILILRHLSARDLAFSALEVCDKWRSIILTWDDVWVGSFRQKSNFEDVGLALEYLKKAPLIRNIYLGKCDCTKGVDVPRDAMVVQKICEMGRNIRVLRINSPHPEDVKIFVQNLPKLKKLQLEIGLYQINSGRVGELKALIAELGSKVDIELVPVGR